MFMDLINIICLKFYRYCCIDVIYDWTNLDTQAIKVTYFMNKLQNLEKQSIKTIK